MDSTKKKALNGVKWTSIQTGIVALLAPLTLFFQARYLSPGEMAYVAIIMIIVALVNVIENMGMSQAIIQNQYFDNTIFTSMFIINMILSFMVSAILYFISPILQEVYQLGNLVNYINLLIIFVLCLSPSLILKAVMQKELLMKPLSIIEMLRNIIQLIVLVVLLKLGFGVISVIISLISGSIVMTVSMITYCFSLNLVKFNKPANLKVILPYFKFGFIVSVKQIFTQIVLKVDEILIGIFLSSEVLGLYYFAKSTLEKLRTLLTSSFSRVLFPYFSKLQNNIPALKKTYYSVTKILAYIAFPTFIGIAVTAHLFIPLLFGEQWVDSLNVFRIISLGLIPMLLTFSVATFLLYSLNKPGIVLKIDLITNTIYILGLFLIARKGAIIIALIYVLFVLLKSLYLQIHVNKSLQGNFYEYLATLKMPVINSIIMVFIILFYYKINTIANDFLTLIVTIVLGVISYFAFTLLFDKNIYISVRKYFNKQKT